MAPGHKQDSLSRKDPPGGREPEPGGKPDLDYVHQEKTRAFMIELILFL